MVKFATAPVEDVAPKRQQRQPSNRALMQAQYQQALHDAIKQQRALVVDLEDDDKPLTIRNRLNRAAQVLGLDPLVIRRRGSQLFAYQLQEAEVPKVGTDDALGG